MQKLTIFYDGTCPICVREMNALKQRDQGHRLTLVDTHSEEFARYPQIDAQKASTVLHALDERNRLLLGLDVTYQAWKLVGKGWLYAPLRWPGIKPLADWSYIKFANNRYTISKWLTGKSKCNNNRCSR
ncbi:thiol-disulfide oxidoreductase DCC family protein [Vibrio japonicus]|uniref:DUF393 domain-containing protein n=1 Tax=Vibrio japonicus TaxID=1824638 RepID=A0ABY5LMK2_9VIBR|nr:DUF393 domain-containing protein [Vibrio japonicus]UUM31909.1 DUF393 domain-containing protein [Vibrio japonicus]